MENGMEISQKIKIELPWSSISTSRYLPEENKNTNSKRYMDPYVHWSTIYNSQGMIVT